MNGDSNGKILSTPTPLVTLLDSVCNGDCVTGLELWVSGYFLVCESLLYYFNKIHFCNSIKFIGNITLLFHPAREVALILGLQR